MSDRIVLKPKEERKQLGVRVPVTQYQAVMELAKRSRRPIQDIVEMALEDFLKRAEVQTVA